MKKAFLRSKTIWCGIVLIILGIYQCVSGQTVDPQAVIEILMGGGLIGLRDAID